MHKKNKGFKTAMRRRSQSQLRINNIWRAKIKLATEDLNNK